MEISALRVGVFHADSRFIEMLSTPMRERGWEVSALAKVPAGPALAELGLNMLVLDVAAFTEARSGWLARERRRAPKVGVVAYAERSTIVQRIGGLEAGLDGWIDEPFHPQEVLARMQAIMRARAARGAIAGRPAIHSGDLKVHAGRFDAVANGHDAGLTTREFELLELLARHEGTVLPRGQIYSGVWGSAVPAGDRSVDIFVSRIRRKLERVSPGWRYLHTHPGEGYRFAAEERERAAHELSETERSAGGQVSQLERFALA